MSPTSEPSLNEATVISYRAGWTETVGLDEAYSIVGIFLKGDYFANTLMHDCDATQGSSGGPILFTASDGTPYIVGLSAYQTPLSRHPTRRHRHTRH